MKFISYSITEDDADRRVDRVIRRFLPDVPLSGIYRFLRKGLIRIDGKKVKPDQKMTSDAVIEIEQSIAPGVKPAHSKASYASSIETLVETPDLLFVNKPRGIPVHGPGGLDLMIPRSGAEQASLSFRSGPLHRLDQGTSGVLAVSRTLKGARWFTDHLSAHLLGKFYLGIAENVLQEPQYWEDVDEDGKEMQTRVCPIVSAKSGSGTQYTLVQYTILTGRKHQIRKQSLLHGFPLSGDTRYGGKPRPDRYFLHAWQLHLPDERLEGLPAIIAAPPPDAMSAAISSIFGDNVLAKLETLTVY